MATKKKTAARKKSPVKKTSTSHKSHKTSEPKKITTDAAADHALKLIDQAAALLRKGVRETASKTKSAGSHAAKEAHTLIGQAHKSLSSLLDSTASNLKRATKKLEDL